MLKLYSNFIPGNSRLHSRVNEFLSFTVVLGNTHGANYAILPRTAKASKLRVANGREFKAF